jgi:hypothetical protein
MLVYAASHDEKKVIKNNEISKAKRALRRPGRAVAVELRLFRSLA